VLGWHDYWRGMLEFEAVCVENGRHVVGMVHWWPLVLLHWVVTGLVGWVFVLAHVSVGRSAIVSIVVVHAIDCAAH
jgi:hypothetical protein